jgi:spore maturation protein CgeB
MRILLTSNKTYRGFLDGSWWYLYLPLKDMGHDVYFYDTVEPLEKDFEAVLDKFKPELIFCCLTNDRIIAPYEPWEQISKETDSGRTTTFNWFCDDTWRYDGFSKIACHYFNVVSTPEPQYVRRYKTDGYSNVILGGWHTNIDLFPALKYQEKDIEVSFMGAMNDVRREFFEKHAEFPIQMFTGVSQEEMLGIFAKTKIGINLSINENDPTRRTQMKQRMFEVPAGKGLLFTEHHPDVEHFFEPNKEIMTFKNDIEFKEKLKFLLNKPKIVEKIATAGHRRFLAEHESKIRLAKILEKIKEF